MKNDHIFDGIAEKFANNIYGTTKGRLRHTLLCDVLAPYLARPLKAIEIGGGTGVMTAHIAAMGHDVVLTDASSDVLSKAAPLLNASDNIRIRHQYLQEIDDLAAYDLVVCHAVLEWLDAPFDAIDFIHKNMTKTFYNEKKAEIFFEKVLNWYKKTPENELARPSELLECLPENHSIVIEIKRIENYLE